jgi:ABC-type multidrug transport system permease subunit
VGAFVALAVPVVMTPMIMFSGILYERGSLPWYFSWLENLSVVNYGFSALMSMQVRTRQLTAPRLY